MAVFLSPGVFVREVDLSLLPTAVGNLRPAFIGTANRGPLNTPVLITNSTQAIETFGEPFPESNLMYAVLAYLEEGTECFVVRVGVECEEGQPDELADICIDTSGNKVEGWGRMPLFTGIDFGRINLRALSVDDPYEFHPASVDNETYNDADLSTTDGATTASISVTGTYTGDMDDSFTVVITGDPDLSAAAALDGATFEVIKNSTGDVVASGELDESVLGESQLISIGDGLTIQLFVTAGVLATNDTFTFTVAPDNRKFKFAVEDVDGAEYTMPTTTYTTAADFVAAFNALLAGEDYIAIVTNLTDGTEIPQVRTTVAGEWIQLKDTSGWAKEVGQQQFAFDIPRSFLIGINEEPYTITSQNNKIVLNVIGTGSTQTVNFTIATGANLLSTQVAASIDPSGIIAGDTFFDSFALTVPGGEEHVLIITSTDHMFDQLQLLANFSNLKTLKFAEEIGIQFPYRRGIRGFNDNRVALPDVGVSDPSIPLSCELAPLSTDCANDSAYFANIVGWLVATSPGTWIDGYTVTLELFTEGVGDAAGRFKLTIKDDNGVVVDVIEDASFDKTKPRYIGNIVNPGSSLGGTNGNAFLNWEERPAFLDFDPDLPSYDVRQPSTFANREFEGMANGIPLDPAFSSELDAAVIGSSALNTGIFAVQNPDTFDINLLVIPGFSSGAVIAQALQMCEGRGDVLFLVDPPFGLRPQQTVDWHNGMLLSDLTAAINSSYGALYWSWVKIFDQFNNIEIFIPPSGHVSGVFSRTSRVAEQWFAPAGLRRGRLLTVLDIEFNPSKGEQNLLYGSGNAVNPILRFPQDGIVVFGQRTLQRQQTALDRVNVRMLMSFLKKNLIRLLRNFIFEPNDEILRAQVNNTLNPFMADIQARRGVTGFKIVCDSTNNTPERVDRNELHVAVFLKPTRAAEFVVLNLVVLRTSASFSSAEVLAAGGIIT